MNQTIKHAILITALASSLQGCIFVAGAAAGAAAIAVVNDRRTVSSTITDTRTAGKINNEYRRYPDLSKNSHIEANVFNGVVLLTGETPNPDWRLKAEQLAKTVPNVDRVYNQITIQGPTSALTRSSDVWITAKIRGEMLAKDNLKSTSIKVVTESGVVYLMGTVTRKQAELAVDVARQVAGVQKVVKVFQYK